jgi:hypothetical protein
LAGDSQNEQIPNAVDLGYILFCYADLASAKAFNPEMRLIQTKTLMQGDDCIKN